MIVCNDDEDKGGSGGQRGDDSGDEKPDQTPTEEK